MLKEKLTFNTLSPENEVVLPSEVYEYILEYLHI